MRLRPVALALLALCLPGCSTWDVVCGTAPGNEDAAKVLAWEKCSAGLGDRQAQYLLGRRYWEGDGVDRDPERAIELLKKAATGREAINKLIFLPPAKGQKYGHVERFRTLGTDGNAEAQSLLAEIRRQQDEAGEPAEDGHAGERQD